MKRKLHVIIHIGKKAPKGFVELPGAVHLGHGIWMFRMERNEQRAKRNTTI